MIIIKHENEDNMTTVKAYGVGEEMNFRERTTLPLGLIGGYTRKIFLQRFGRHRVGAHPMWVETGGGQG